MSSYTTTNVNEDGVETIGGTENITGTLKISGTAQTFPASGILAGTTDAQTLTNKTIVGAIVTAPQGYVFSAGPIGLAGKLYSTFTPSANTDTSEDVLATFTLPASVMSGAGTMLRVKAFGTFGATGNNKTVRLYFGAAVLTSGTLTDNAKNWTAELIVGRSGTNSQSVLGTMVHDTANITPYFNAATETEAGTIVVKCSGQSGTAANDIVLKGFIVEILT